ncbi:Serine/threonine-protein phosphatase 7 long form [Glycine max]|nr:Serine/threonine-protein phosphatase 7 long form [Glycine max]
MFQDIFGMGKKTENYTRAIPIYQGQEEIPEEIISLLRQSGFHWIMKMGYLKINVALISALIERWRPETHTFHMRWRECTITLQDVSVLLGLCVDGSPLISPTNLDWTDLCEELLGVRPQEGELQGGVLFVDKGSNKVSLRYAWGPVVLVYLYREMCSATDYKTKSIGGTCILIQMWAWERCTSLAPKRTPPVLENKPLRHSVAWCTVVPLICFQVIEWHQPDRILRQFGMQQPISGCPSQPLNIHGITLKGKQDENWGQLFAPMISQWNNRADFRVDVYPRQEGLLSFNSDYMVWCRRKTKMFVDPKNANTTTLQDDAPIPTPNAPLGTQWNVPGAIHDMDDLLGVDLHHQFSAKADQVEAGRHRGRRNPDRAARRWERPCGTSSRHHGHYNK